MAIVYCQLYEEWKRRRLFTVDNNTSGSDRVGLLFIMPYFQFSYIHSLSVIPIQTFVVNYRK